MSDELSGGMTVDTLSKFLSPNGRAAFKSVCPVESCFKLMSINESQMELDEKAAGVLVDRVKMLIEGSTDKLPMTLLAVAVALSTSIGYLRAQLLQKIIPMIDVSCARSVYKVIREYSIIAKEPLDFQVLSRAASSLLAEYDIRQEELLELEILKGLGHPDSKIQKSALHFLKQCVGTDCALQNTIKSNLIPHGDERAWGEQWGAFFLLYETLSEPQVHLLTPLLPLFKRFVYAAPWWNLLVERGMSSQSVAVRKCMYEYVMSLRLDDDTGNSTIVPFALNVFPGYLDSSALYSALDYTRLVSPFGLQVTSFYGRLIDAIGNVEERARRIQAIIKNAATMTSNMAILFILNALVSSAPLACLFDEHLELVRVISEYRGFHNRQARCLLHRQLLEILWRFCDPKRVELMRLLQILAPLMPSLEGTPNRDTKLRQCAQWLTADGALFDVERVICEEYYDLPEDTLPLCIVSRAEGIACLASFLLMGENALTAVVFRELMVRLNEVISSPLQDTHISMAPFRSAALLNALQPAISSVRTAVDGTVGLIGLREKVFNVIARLDEMLLPDVGGDVERGRRGTLLDAEFLQSVTYRPVVEQLLLCLSLLLREAAQTEPRMIIEYGDMMLIRAVQWLQHFSVSRQSERMAVEGLDVQMAKVVVLGELRAVLEAIEGLEHGPSVLLQADVQELILSVVLERPVGLSDRQWQEWSEMAAALVEHRWRALAALCRCLGVLDRGARAGFSARAVYQHALHLLPDSQYASSVAIMECLRDILVVFNQEDTKVSNDKDSQGLILSETWQVCEAFLLAAQSESKSKWFHIYAAAVIDLFTNSDAIMTTRSLHSPSDGPLYRLFVFYLRTVGPERKGLLPGVIERYCRIWKADRVIRDYYSPVMPALLMFGPVRSAPEERLASGLLRQLE